MPPPARLQSCQGGATPQCCSDANALLGPGGQLGLCLCNPEVLSATLSAVESNPLARSAGVSASSIQGVLQQCGTPIAGSAACPAASAAAGSPAPSASPAAGSPAPSAASPAPSSASPSPAVGKHRLAGAKAAGKHPARDAIAQAYTAGYQQRQQERQQEQAQEQQQAQQERQSGGDNSGQASSGSTHQWHDGKRHG